MERTGSLSNALFCRDCNEIKLAVGNAEQEQKKSWQSRAESREPREREPMMDDGFDLFFCVVGSSFLLRCFLEKRQRRTHAMPMRNPRYAYPI